VWPHAIGLFHEAMCIEPLPATSAPSTAPLVEGPRDRHVSRGERREPPARSPEPRVRAREREQSAGPLVHQGRPLTSLGLVVLPQREVPMGTQIRPARRDERTILAARADAPAPAP
jgi:hypothetical protein